MKMVKEKKAIVGLKELRENMETYITRVRKGESFTIVRRNEPVFRLTPADADESVWETVVDFTKIDPRGVPADDVLEVVRKLNG